MQNIILGHFLELLEQIYLVVLGNPFQCLIGEGSDGLKDIMRTQ